MSFSTRPDMQFHRPFRLSRKHTRLADAVHSNRHSRRLPRREAVCRRISGNNGTESRARQRPQDGHRRLTTVLSLAVPFCSSTSAFASVLVTPDCPAEPEPLVQFLLAALIFGCLLRIKQIIFHGNPVGSLQDDKLLVARAQARHREFLRSQGEQSASPDPAKLLEPSDGSVAFTSLLWETARMLSALGSMSRRLASVNNGPEKAKASSEKDLGSNLLVAERPRGLTLPAGQLPALPQDTRGKRSPSTDGMGRKGFNALASPFQALWAASKTAAGALRSAVLPKPPLPALAPSSATFLEDSGLADNLPGFDSSQSFGPGSIPGRFAVNAAAVVADLEPEVMERSAGPVPASVYPALEDLFLRSPDKTTLDSAGPAQVRQGRGEAGINPAQPQSKRIRRDPADYLAPPTSRARAMLQLEKDRVTTGGPAMASVPVPQQRATAASAPQPFGNELKTFRRTLDLPDGFRRAPPAKGVRLASTPAQIAKSRSMANLSEENGVRVRGASARAQQGVFSLAEEPQVRAAAYNAEVAELKRAAERRQQETDKWRERELHSKQAGSATNTALEPRPWTTESSNAVREALKEIHRPGAWAFVRSVWTGISSNLAYGVSSRFASPGLQR